MRRILSGLDRYRVLEPLFEAVRVVLSYRGESTSAAYVQGISGAAFRVAGICPCAPTCSCAMTPAELASALGYEARQVSLEQAGIAPERLRELAGWYGEGRLPTVGELSEQAHRALRAGLDEIVAVVKDEIDRGRPAVVWHAFTHAECDVVAGYDDETGEFLGRGSYAGQGEAYARAPQLRMATSVLTGGWPGVLAIGERTRRPDMAGLELAALRAAVEHARWRPAAGARSGEWTFFEGLAAYDRWAQDFADPKRTREAGDAYCHGVYRSTHGAASDFLREIAPRHPNLAEGLLQASACFQREVAALDAGEQLLGWGSPEGPDAGRNRSAVEVLVAARDAYAAGIEALERVLEVG